MAEMDIYMRRRLVALGGLVVFFIFFVLLVKSCGGDEETPTTSVPTGATGEGGTVALTEDEFFTQADDICAAANNTVGGLDPADPDATKQEFATTRDELAGLNALIEQYPDASPKVAQFVSALSDVVDALNEKSRAITSGDVAAEDTAQAAIDTAEVEARELGEQAKFADCGQFLDAGEGPSAGGTDTGTDTGTETDPGTIAPTTPTDPGTVTPPATDPGTTPTEPPTDDGGGGISG